jgi:4-carboxymuconolactone decarboxylase
MTRLDPRAGSATPPVADPGRDAAPPRLAKLAPAALDDDQRRLYESIAGGPRARGPQAFALTDDEGGLEGPFNAMLLSPSVGAALQALGTSVRYRSALTDRSREMAILVVAHHWDSGFERHAHEAVGRTVGLTDAEINALRDGRPGGLSPVERAVVAATRALVADGDLTDEDYRVAVDALGLPVLFELTTLVGYYATLALQLRVFRVSAPG